MMSEDNGKLSFVDQAFRLEALGLFYLRARLVNTQTCQSLESLLTGSLALDEKSVSRSSASTPSVLLSLQAQWASS